MNIIPVISKGDNYYQWEKGLCNAFQAKHKLDFLDGLILELAATTEEYDDWASVNSMLVAWVLQSIETSFNSSITYYESVKSLWDDFKQRFYIDNASYVHQLRTKIAQCDQKGHSVAAYFG